jgi:phosphatidylglycerol:prolipoprotein diacylglycerol transferase
VLLARQRLSHPPYAALKSQGVWSVQDIDDATSWGVLGVVLGRSRGVLPFLQTRLLRRTSVGGCSDLWQGGMSFHGGTLGVILAMALWARLRARHWLQVTDFVAPCVPTGLAAGRVGNFING